MNTIEMERVLPDVFAAEPPAGSDVWLRGVRFERGRRYLVEADSGTGKSTLCSFIYGSRDDYRGAILFDGDPAPAIGRRWTALRRTSLAMMFQGLRLFGELTVRENVMLKNNLTGWKTAEQIDRLFEESGIAAHADRPAAKLSFGQQQRVAFVRMVCQPADFFIMDEPVSHLDERNAATMGRILAAEAAAQGAGVIVTSIGRHFDMEYDKTLML